MLGSGVVGMSVGSGLSQINHKVIFYDIDHNRIEVLRSHGLNATDDINAAVLSSRVSFICVPTPTVRRQIDLSYIKSVSRKLADALKMKEGYHLVVVKSTVLPTTTEKVVIPILKRYSGKKIGRHVGVCVNPEFLTEIHSSWTYDRSLVRDFFSEPFIVIGEYDRRSGDTLQEIYRHLKSPVVRTDLKTAEMIKYASNCALASKISYWNEIFLISKRLDINSELVASTVAMDQRIGKYGTVHGKAFGGKCLPKDLRAFIGFSKRIGHNPRLLSAVEEINLRMALEYGIRQ